MAGLSVLEHQAVVVEGLSGHDSQAVVIAQFQIGFIGRGHMLHRHGPAAGDDGHLQFVLDVFVDGLFRDDFRETRYQTFQEKVGVEDERFAVQIPDTAHIVEGVARLKTRPAGETLIADNFVKLHDLCDIRPVVAPGGFLKTRYLRVSGNWRHPPAGR